jgi:hypothetical protein
MTNPLYGDTGNDIYDAMQPGVDVIKAFMSQDFTELMTGHSMWHPMLKPSATREFEMEIRAGRSYSSVCSEIETLVDDLNAITAGTVDLQDILQTNANGRSFMEVFKQGTRFLNYQTKPMFYVPSTYDQEQQPFFKAMANSADTDERFYDQTFANEWWAWDDNGTDRIDIFRILHRYITRFEDGSIMSNHDDSPIKMSFIRFADDLVFDSSGGWLGSVREEMFDVGIKLGLPMMDFFIDVLVKKFFIDIVLRIQAAGIVGLFRAVIAYPAYYLGKYILDWLLPILDAADNKRVKDGSTGVAEAFVNIFGEDIPPVEDMVNTFTTFMQTVDLDGLSSSLQQHPLFEGMMEAFKVNVEDESDAP